MVGTLATGVSASLLATGITAGTKATASKARKFIREREISDELGEAATEFNKALKQAIKGESHRRDIQELEEFTDNWQAIAEELADTPEAYSPGTRRSSEEFDILFKTEQEAITCIAEAYTTVKGIDPDKRPEPTKSITNALTHAYRRAINEFEAQIVDTRLADQFEAEVNLSLVKQLDKLDDHLATMEQDINHLLTKDIYNEGFRYLSWDFFARQPTSPETCWRVGFSLADVEADIPALAGQFKFNSIAVCGGGHRTRAERG